MFDEDDDLRQRHGTMMVYNYSRDVEDVGRRWKYDDVQRWRWRCAV